MVKIWKGATDNNKALLTLLTYGLDIHSLNIQQDYISNGKQRIKVDCL